ncbi:response regulator transcription factor [Glaciimonas sp. PAMC28666]|uniref:response regulator n=1 Tax=Glaciimonas sp. PAMC28666 TaxID=2807626 RepID=UPI0019646C43|nr:response regulator transcription factor [Glaciimonas sp. PAMC28666]QRX82344.1 response regulator transcription factor [Glaciimonas sp. PAMC28666]
MRILLAEDDPSLGATVQSWLQLDGYAVDWVQRGDSAAMALQTHNYDCLLLDRGLPGISGDQLLTQLRANKDLVPVLMFTARDTLGDRIGGLDLGADDYLIKPVDLEEMSARIRAAMRRHGYLADNLINHANITLDIASKRVTCDGALVELTAREFAVLHALMLHRKQIVTRAQIEEALYGWGEEVESNAIEVHIHHLRKKLGASLIITVRNLGYRLKEDHV